MKLSIIIPSYNEENTVREIIEKVFAVDFGEIKYEVIFVDDGSTDGTQSILKSLNHNFKSVVNDRRGGKSAAVRKGIELAEGDYIVTQDADLELDPNDIKTLINHAIENNLDVVYGSRMLGSKKGTGKVSFYYMGGVFVTGFANLIYNTKITDEPTCYKLVNSQILNRLNLKENRFGYCAEVTAKISKLGYKIHELPIKYTPRTVAEGKKIRWKDGLHAIWILSKYRVLPKRFWLKY